MAPHEQVAKYQNHTSVELQNRICSLTSFWTNHCWCESCIQEFHLTFRLGLSSDHASFDLSISRLCELLLLVSWLYLVITIDEFNVVVVVHVAVHVAVIVVVISALCYVRSPLSVPSSQHQSHA